MTEVVPAGTKCDADCIAWAQTRITILSVMLPLFFCRHHELQLTAAMDETPSIAYEAEYNTINV